MADLRPLLLDLSLGLMLALAVLGMFVLSGGIWGQKPTVWTCDDTTYSRTGPVGFDVIGPTVRPVPGCGDP